ncbi:hypothetical protein [Streptomyces sp. NPDC051546]|uniref:hypothetical protein n=1 Tax=Streptomyces sp. NPDC051546 TaxID=3365655 RepID=UPI0037B63EB9
MSALKWQGWLVALVFVAGLLVFAPLGLYVWAGGRPAVRPAGAAPDDVRITDCRIDPTSRRVVASVEAVNGYPEPGSYVVTVEFREPPAPTLAPPGGADTPGGGGGRAVRGGPSVPGAPTGQGAPGADSTGPAGQGAAGVPAARGPQVLVRIPGVRPAATERAEAVGPVWPPAAIPWCGVAAAEFAPAPPFARSLGLRPSPRASNAGEAEPPATRQPGSAG